MVFSLKEEGHFSISFKLKSTDNVVKLFNGYYDGSDEVLSNLPDSYKPLKTDYVCDFSNNSTGEYRFLIKKETDPTSPQWLNHFFTRDGTYDTVNVLPEQGDLIICNGFLLKDISGVPVTIKDIEPVSTTQNNKKYANNGGLGSYGLLGGNTDSSGQQVYLYVDRVPDISNHLLSGNNDSFLNHGNFGGTYHAIDAIFIKRDELMQNKHSLINQGYLSPFNVDLITNDNGNIEIDWTNLSRLCDCHETDVNDIEEDVNNYAYWLRNTVPTDAGYGNYNVITNNGKITHKDINAFHNLGLEAPKWDKVLTHNLDKNSMAHGIQYDISESFLGNRIYRNLNKTGEMTIDNDVWPLMVDKGTNNGENSLSHPLSPYIISVRNSDSDSSTFSSREPDTGNRDKIQHNIMSVSGNYMRNMSGVDYEYNDKGSYRYSWLNGSTIWSYPYGDNIINENYVSSFAKQSTIINNYETEYKTVIQEYLKQKHPYDWSNYLNTELKDHKINKFWSQTSDASFNWNGRNIYPYSNFSNEANIMPIFTSALKSKNYIMNIIKSYNHCENESENYIKLSRGSLTEPKYSNEKKHRPLFSGDKAGGNSEYVNYIAFEPNNYNNGNKKSMIIDDNYNTSQGVSRYNGKKSILSFSNNNNNLFNGFDGQTDEEKAKQNLIDISDNHDLSSDRKSTINHILKSNENAYSYNYDISSNTNNNNEYYSVKNNITEKIYYKQDPISSLTASGNFYYHDISYGRLDISNNVFNQRANMKFKITNIDKYKGITGSVGSRSALHTDGYYSMAISGNYENVNYDVIPFCEQNKSLRVNGIVPNTVSKYYPLTDGTTRINNMKGSDIYNGFVYRVAFTDPNIGTTTNKHPMRDDKIISVLRYETSASSYVPGQQTETTDCKILMIIKDSTATTENIQEIYFLSPKKFDLEYESNNQYFIGLWGNTQNVWRQGGTGQNWSTTSVADATANRGQYGFPVITPQQLAHTTNDIIKAFTSTDSVDNTVLKTGNRYALFTETQVYRLENISDEITELGPELQASTSTTIEKGSIISYNHSYGRLLHSIPNDKTKFDNSIYVVSINNKIFREAYGDTNKYNSIKVYRTKGFGDNTSADTSTYGARNKSDNSGNFYVGVPETIRLINNRLKVSQLTPNIIVYSDNNAANLDEITFETNYNERDVKILRQEYNNLPVYVFNNANKGGYRHSDNFTTSSIFSSTRTTSLACFTNSLTNSIASHNTFSTNNIGTTVIPDTITLYGVKKTGNFFTNDVVFSNQDGSELTDASVNETQSWGVVTDMKNTNDDVNIKVCTLIKVNLYGKDSKFDNTPPEIFNINTRPDKDSNIFGRNSEIMIMDERLLYDSDGAPTKITNLSPYVKDNNIIANGNVISDKYEKDGDEFYSYIFVNTKEGIFYGNGPVYINGTLIGEAIQISTKYDFIGNLYKLHYNTTEPYPKWTDTSDKGPYPTSSNTSSNISNYKIIDKDKRLNSNLGDISSYYPIHLETMKIRLDNANYHFTKGDVITYMKNNTPEYDTHDNKQMIIKHEFALAKGTITKDTLVECKNMDSIIVRMETLDDIPISYPKYQNFNYKYNSTGNLDNGSLIDNYEFQYRKRTNYSLFNGMMGFKLRQEYVEAKENNPQIDPSGIKAGGGTVGGGLDGSGHNVTRTNRYNRLYDLSFNSDGKYHVKFADSNINVHDRTTLLDSGSKFWENVELDLKDNMPGTEIILLSGYQSAGPFDDEKHELIVADLTTNNDNLNYVYIKYQTNYLYDVSGNNETNNPIFEHYVIKNEKQWGWDTNTVLKISKNEKGTLDQNNLFKPSVSTTKVIKISNYYRFFSTPSVITTENKKVNDSTYVDTKSFNEDSYHYRNQLIKKNNKNKYDDLITFYGYDYPQLGRNKQGMLIDSNIGLKTTQLTKEDSDKIDNSKYTYNPYNVLDMQWTSTGDVTKNNELNSNIDGYNGGQVTYLGSAESPQFGTEMRSRPVKIKKITGDWVKSSSSQSDRDKDTNGDIIEREFTVSFNSKNITQNYNNIQPTYESKYREESIYSSEFELYADLYQRNLFNKSSSDLQSGSPLNNCKAKFVKSTVSSITSFNNMTDFYAPSFGGKLSFNSYHEKDVRLLDDSIFSDVSSNLFSTNSNTEYININTIRGLKDLSGTSNVNENNVSVFVFNNSYDTINAARMFTNIRKLNKLTDDTSVPNGPDYKQLTSELYKHKIYPQKGLINKNNWILFYFNDKQDNSIFDQSGICIYLKNSKFTVDVLNKQTIDNSLMLRNKKMMVFLHYMNNTGTEDTSYNIIPGGTNKFYNSFLRNKFRSLKSIVEIGTVPLSLMAYKIGSSNGKLLVEENSNKVQFNENILHTKKLFINKSIEKSRTSFGDKDNNQFDWEIGSTQQLNFYPKGNVNHWTIQGHSNFWSHGLSNYYGTGLNSGEGFSVSTATVKDNNNRNFSQWSLQKTTDQINALRTPRLYFKFGEINTYPSQKQTDSGKDPWNEPTNTLGFISAYPDKETQNGGNAIKNTETDQSSNYVPGTPPQAKIDGEVPIRILNNFTGQHKVISDLIDEDTNYIGCIVSSSGKTINYKNDKKVRGKNGIDINEALPEVDLSDEFKDNKVIGVISGVEDENDEYRKSLISSGSFNYFAKKDVNRLIINSLGEGAILVCNKNGNLENGDYICSSEIPGIGCKQDDDVKHSYTVAKITINCKFQLNSKDYYCSEKDGVKYAFVSCTYHCG